MSGLGEGYQFGQLLLQAALLSQLGPDGSQLSFVAAWLLLARFGRSCKVPSAVVASKYEKSGIAGERRCRLLLGFSQMCTFRTISQHLSSPLGNLTIEASVLCLLFSHIDGNVAGTKRMEIL